MDLCVNKGSLGEEEWNICLEVSQRGENKKILIPCHKLKFDSINMKESIWYFYVDCGIYIEHVKWGNVKSI